MPLFQALLGLFAQQLPPLQRALRLCRVHRLQVLHLLLSLQFRLRRLPVPGTAPPAQESPPPRSFCVLSFCVFWYLLWWEACYLAALFCLLLWYCSASPGGGSSFSSLLRLVLGSALASWSCVFPSCSSSWALWSSAIRGADSARPPSNARSRLQRCSSWRGLSRYFISRFAVFWRPGIL